MKLTLGFLKEVQVKEDKGGERSQKGEGVHRELDAGGGFGGVAFQS